MSTEPIGDQSAAALCFDGVYYRSQVVSEIPNDVSVWNHYLEHGERAGYWPNAVFDPVHYAKVRPDVVSAKVSLFPHFVDNGQFEGTLPVDLGMPGLETKLQDFLSIHRGDKIAQTIMASLFFEQGRHDDALSWAKRICPVNVNSLFVACRALLARHRYAEAFEFARRFSDSDSIHIAQTAIALIKDAGYSATVKRDFAVAVDVYAYLNERDGLSSQSRSALVDLQLAYLEEVRQVKGWREAIHLNHRFVAAGTLERADEVRLETVLENSRLSGDFYVELLPARDISAPQLDFCGDEVKLSSQRGDLLASAQYISLIKNAKIYSGCNIVRQGDRALYDLAVDPRSQGAVLGDRVPGHIRSIIRIRQDRQVLIEEASEPTVDLKVGIMMSGVGSKNYGHWFLEFLPRMQLFNLGFCPEDYPILIDEGMPKTHLEALQVLNTKNRKIVEIQSKQTVRVDCLAVAPVPNYFPLAPRRNIYDTVWPQDVFIKLRAMFLQSVALANSAKRRRVFISRRAFSQRRMLNENQVWTLLADYGFERIYPEEMSFREQLECFSAAEVVVGSCSSALTNCLFCQPGALVIGLVHGFNFNFNGYASFISASGAIVKFLRSSNSDYRGDLGSIHSDYVVDVQRLRVVVESSGIARRFSVVSALQKMAHASLDLAGNFSRRSQIIFDEKYYIQSNPALNLEFGEGYSHYLNRGMDEGRLPIAIDAPGAGYVVGEFLKRNPRDALASELSALIAAKQGTLDFLSFSVARLSVNSAREAQWKFGVSGAFEECASRLYTDWSQFRSLELIGGLSSLFSQLASLIPSSKILAAYGGLGLYECGDLRRAAEVLSGVDVEVLPVNLAGRCTDVLRQIDEAFRINNGKSTDSRILLLDTSFPSRVSSFRFGEFSTYLDRLPESRLQLRPDINILKLGEQQSFEELVRNYEEEAGLFGKIRSFAISDTADQTRQPNVAYCVFLTLADLFFTQLAVRADSYIFTLYPGGGFAPGDETSDEKLRRLCQNPRLAKIITTQVTAYDYLIKNGFCDESKVVHIYGGIVPAAYGSEIQREYSSVGHNPLQICFVAQRYSRYGAEKGYDIFAALIRELANREKFHFHVVGGFDRGTINLNEARNVTFYGSRPAEFFPDFYSRMDIVLSPNIAMAELDPSQPRMFDGFPTTAVVEAGLHGVAMLISDYEKMNRRFDGTEIFSSEEMMIIHRNVHELVGVLIELEADRVRLKNLAIAGQRALRREFSFERQMLPRLELLRAYAAG